MRANARAGWAPGVEQAAALAAHGLGDEEGAPGRGRRAGRPGRPEGGWVELHKLHVGHGRLGPEGHGHAVAGGDRRVGRQRVRLPTRAHAASAGARRHRFTRHARLTTSATACAAWQPPAAQHLAPTITHPCGRGREDAAGARLAGAAGGQQGHGRHKARQRVAAGVQRVHAQAVLDAAHLRARRQRPGLAPVAQSGCTAGTGAQPRSTPASLPNPTPPFTVNATQQEMAKRAVRCLCSSPVVT